MSSYFLAPSPKWYFLTAQGRPANGGKMYTYSAANHVEPLPIFANADGTGEYPNPMTLDGTGGTEAPMYWLANPDGDEGLYYVVIQDAEGNDICPPIDHFPTTGNGGSTPVTSNEDNSNHIINGNFHLTIDDIFGGLSASADNGVPITPVPEGSTFIAPGGGALSAVRDGYWTGGRYTANPNPTVKTGWIFRKTGGPVADDFLTFETPAPGSIIPGGPSANAPRYIQYEADVSTPSSLLEFTYVIADVRTLAGEEITLSFDCFSDVGSGNVAAQIYQNFGTGGSAEVITEVFHFTYPSTSQWARRSGSITLPSISGGGHTIGPDGDDHIRVSFQVPVNSPTSIGKFGITNAQLQRGNFITTTTGLPNFIYETFSETAYKSVLELIYGLLPKTGDTKFSFSPFPTNGWIVLQDDVNNTLGSADSDASYKGIYVRNLYNFFWDAYSQSYFHVDTGRGVSAQADFDANKKMWITPMAGRVLGLQGVGRTAAGGGGSNLTARIPGEFFGKETDHITEPQLPSHTHTAEVSGGAAVAGSDEEEKSAGSGTTSVINGAPLVIGNTGSGDPFSVMQPTTFLYVHIKL